MSQSQGILRQIRKLAVGCSSEHSDLDLVSRFLAERDESAFATIVQRHGGMVLGLCRNVLCHTQDAEDVFQATFLVLACKAHTIRKQQSLSSWLHGVAYRLALKARGQTIRRRIQETSAVAPGEPPRLDDLTLSELNVILHEELHRLPEHYRAPLVLCYWEGKTRDEAADQLGVTGDAFKKYLERARKLLGSRLVQRGLAPSAALVATLLAADGVRAAVPQVLIQSTAQAATAFAVGSGAAGASTAAVALAQGAILTMTITKWATAILALILITGFGAAVSFGAYQVLYGQPAAVGVEPQQATPVQAKAGKLTDKERIVGVWRFVDGRVNGEGIPDELKTLARLTFTKDNKTIMTMIEEAKEGSYNLPGAGEIDLVFSKNDKDAAFGIFKFDGDDRLTICAGKGDGKRPTEYRAEKNEERMLIVLQRARPGEEKVKVDDKQKRAIDKAKEAAARAVSANNLKQIAIAFHNYHDANGTFPAHAIYDKDGKKPLLSWRVAILPYIEQDALYKKFKLDEPWDSEHNKKLLDVVPSIYLPPAKQKGTQTFYQVFTGPNTVFNGNKKLKVTDITDGTSNTLMAVEAKNSVPWTKPDDVTLPKDKDKLPAVGGLFTSGFNALFCDGSVRFMSHKVAPEIFRPFVTPAGGEVIDFDKLDKE